WRLEATGTYTDDEINRLAKGGKQQGHIPGVGRVLPARTTASPSAGTTRRVPTIRTTRMRMEMAILSCVIYGSFPGDMSPGNMCHCGTYFLTGKYVGPTVSPGIVAGKESLTSILQRPFPGDKSPWKPIPSDKSPGKAWICRWGRGLML
nr:F-box domain, leucine-rich repeat domain, L domain-like protein [Tanacetum cinerariifolium]